MELIFFDVKLTPLSLNDIETVRNWRNSEHVRSKMIVNNEITPSEQKEWFNNLSSERDFYFIASFKDEKIGLFNIKNIDWNKREGEPGGFIGELKYINTYVPAMCFIALFNFAFYDLKLNLLKGQILISNLPSLDLTQKLGVKLEKESAGIYSTLHSEPEYRLAVKRYVSALNILYS